MRRTLVPILVVPVLLAVLTLRALFPTGWMPMAETGGGVSWRICPEFVTAPAQAPAVAAPMAHDGGHHAQHHDRTQPAPAEHGKDSCPFGALAEMGGILDDAPAIMAALRPAEAPPIPLFDLAFSQRRWLSHALARGPPTFA